MNDLGAAADRIVALLPDATDERFGRATPCADLNVGDLLDHLMALTLAFRYAAEKTGEEFTTAAPPVPSARNLGPDWRAELTARLSALVEAWRRPEAWQGTTHAGGVQLTGEAAGVIALDELVMHGWDLARGLGLPYEPDEESVRAIFGFLQESAAEGADREGLFGPVVPVGADAALFDQALGLAGRDPSWAPERCE